MSSKASHLEKIMFGNLRRGKFTESSMRSSDRDRDRNYHSYSRRSSKNKQEQGWDFRGMQVDDMSIGGFVTRKGLISIRLSHGIKVDISVNKAIRIQNNTSSVIISLSADGSTSTLIHPSGRVYQYGSRVEITTMDHHGNCKFAKMWHKGVSFTSEACPVVYLVDTAGTRTTTDVFSDMSGDFSKPIFEDKAMIGEDYVEQAIVLLRSANYWVTEDGVENWMVNGIRVSQTQDGMVRVGRSLNKYQFRTSPINGTASLSTPYVHCTASVGKACHLFVKRGERRMHYDGSSFIVRNAGHSAGFDDKNMLKVY